MATPSITLISAVSIQSTSPVLTPRSSAPSTMMPPASSVKMYASRYLLHTICSGL